MLNIINVMTKNVLDDLYNDSAFTFEGLTVDRENLEALEQFIEQFTPFKRKDVYITKGSIMNSIYGLTGTVAYNDDLNIVSIKLSDLEQPTNLVIPKMRVGARWFNDIVDNNCFHLGVDSPADEFEDDIE